MGANWNTGALDAHRIPQMSRRFRAWQQGRGGNWDAGAYQFGSTPYASWMRRELTGWLRDILFDRRTLERGYFDKGLIERVVSANQEHGNLSKEVFSLVVLELWHRTFLDTPPSQSIAKEAVASQTVS
jgi:hypothetical protein